MRVSGNQEAKFVTEDEAAGLLAARIDEITAELKAETLDPLVRDLELSRRFASDAKKIVSGQPHDDDLAVLDDYRQRVEKSLAEHKAKPLPSKAVRLDNLRNADPAAVPLRAHPAVVAALERLVTTRDQIDQAMSGLSQALAAIESAAAKAQKLRSGTLEGLEQRVRQAEVVPDNRRRLAELAQALEAIVVELASMAETERAVA